MKIRISRLHNGTNQWTESINPSDIDLSSDEYSHSVNVNFTVEKFVGKININVDVHTAGRFICDRCGNDFEWEVDGVCSVHFIQRDVPLPDEMPGDDMRSFTIGQEELDISQEIRDALLLSIPLKRLCSDSCKGLCINCGTNLNRESCQCADRKK